MLPDAEGPRRYRSLSAALGVYELRADHVLAQDVGAEAVLVEGERLEPVVDRQG